jgi:hypothetical protein
MFVWGCPVSALGRRSCDRPHSKNLEFPRRGFTPAVARYVTSPDRCPGTGSLKRILPRKSSYLAAARGLTIWRLIAQMKAESSRATSVTATVLSLPFRVSAGSARYWLSTLPETTAFDRLVYFAKLHWHIERDYQGLKQEVGLGHFEGRGWRGFHHHATLCIAAYSFLISERRRFPLRTLFHRVALDACGIRQLQTHRLRPCGLNVTSRTRLQQCEDDYWSLLSRDCRDAHAAPLQCGAAQPYTYDAVRLANGPQIQ